MPSFRYVGFYPANVTLPDGSTVLAQPGVPVELDTDEPGPLWAAADPAPKKPRKTTVSGDSAPEPTEPATGGTE